jgi:acyl dehydratase/NAD(P)-dependent dehydrogenase (short-subunit alcohol dehydrogenase family)
VIDRTFSIGDQERFANVTGDRNPMHVDPLAARRTLAGEPVVHGVHVLMWALDALADMQALPVPSRVHVSFLRFLPVGERAISRVVRHTSDYLDLEVSASGVIRCTIRLTFGATSASTISIAKDAPLFVSPEPLDLPVTAMAGLVGRVPPAVPAPALAAMFPAAARWLSAERLASLGACTRLVGMTCPGLNSLFSGLTVTLGQPEPGYDGTIGFAVGAVRHGLVKIDIAGGGIAGQLAAVIRAAPRRQPSMAELVARVPQRAFAGQRVVVAGGSRGLGEIVAKLLAAGGADVVVTWSTGEADAAAVADNINSAGGRCDTLRYRIETPRDLDLLSGEAPTHGYYFAAPMIARPSSQVFNGDRLTNLQRFFVEGFWRFALAMRERRAGVRLFYPSTVYVEDRPRGLVEYAMAKAAGEILCAEMNAQLAPLTAMSARLPRMPTDQTAGVLETEMVDPVATLLPLVLEVQRARK